MSPKQKPPPLWLGQPPISGCRHAGGPARRLPQLPGPPGLPHICKRHEWHTTNPSTCSPDSEGFPSLLRRPQVGPRALSSLPIPGAPLSCLTSTNQLCHSSQASCSSPLTLPRHSADLQGKARSPLHVSVASRCPGCPHSASYTYRVPMNPLVLISRHRNAAGLRPCSPSC